jgi:transposase
MHYVGADLHKERTWLYVMDEQGSKVSSMNVSNEPRTLEAYVAGIPRPFNIAVESTYNWYFFMDIVERYAATAFLANSYELKAFAKRHKKTDKIDARLIADVLRKGYLPAVFIPDRKTRQLRELLSCRMSLVKDRSRAIFRLKALLDKQGIPSTGNFTTHKRLHKIPVQDMPVEYAISATHAIETILFLDAKIYTVDKDIKQQGCQDPHIQNLITIPSIDYFSAMLIKTEIGDIARFASFARLCAYAGLAPRVAQSANKSFHGPLNNNRRKKLQWILIEVVYHFIRQLPDKQAKYDAIAARKGTNTAKIVLARDLLKIVYHVLKEQRPFVEHPAHADAA